MRLSAEWAKWKRTAADEDLFVLISRGCLYAGMFFLTLLHFKATKGLNLSDAIFLVGFLFLVLSRRPPPRAPRTPAWYVGAFIWLLAGTLASTQADLLSQSILVVLDAVYVFFVLQYLLRQQLGTTLHLQRAIGAFVLGTTLSALVAILQVTLHVFLFHASTSGGSSASIGGNSRAIGLSNQPNLAGIAFSLGMIFAIGLLLELGFRRHWYLGVCVALLASALLLSGSVSGMACTIAGILVLFIARGVPLKTVLMVVLSFAVVYVLVFGVIDRGSKLDPVTRIEKATNSSGGSGSGTFELRVHTWGAAWREIQQSPVIGHGLDQETLALYYDQSLYVYYAPHNLILLYWYGGGIFLLVAMFIMMGSSFSRLLTGWRAQRRAGTRDPLRDVVLAACVADLVFCMQSPELVDRWLWIPFLLALCFRDSMNPPASARVTIARPEPLPVPPAPLAPAGNGAPSGNGQSRRVSGTVGRHAASAPVGGSEPGSSTGLPGPGAGVARHASTPPSSR